MCTTTGWLSTWGDIDKLLDSKTLVGFRRFSTISNKIMESDTEFMRWSGLCAELVKNGEMLPEDFRDPMIGDPAVQEFLGVPTTTDSLRAACLVHIISTALSELGEVKDINVLEVGAGYGMLADKLLRKYSINKYHLLDADVMQRLQGYYLSEAGHGDRISFRLPTEPVQLIVAINVLSEMRLEFVRYYAKLFGKLLEPDKGLLFLQQRKWKGDHILVNFDEVMQVLCDTVPKGRSWDMVIVDPETITDTRLNLRVFVECYGMIREAGKPNI